MKKTKSNISLLDDEWPLYNHAYTDCVLEQDYPRHSSLLGPDGKSLAYEKQPMGFDMRPKKGKA